MVKSAIGKLLLVGLAMAAAVPASAEPRQVPQIRLADAQAMARKVVELATAKGLNVSMVVVNREGRVILSQRMDDASYFSLEVAKGKAITAATTGVPTLLLDQMPEKDKLSLLTVPDIVTIAGGVPIIISGSVVAGIGVSGAAPQDDNGMAEGGVKAALPTAATTPQ